MWRPPPYLVYFWEAESSSLRPKHPGKTPKAAIDELMFALERVTDRLRVSGLSTEPKPPPAILSLGTEMMSARTSRHGLTLLGTGASAFE